MWQVNGASPPATLHADRFEVTLGNGQVWLLFAAKKVEARLGKGGANLTFAECDGGHFPLVVARRGELTGSAR
jgi:hypothetical protein